ncbi:protein misato homolog 1-like [Halichondria panicea]|uniref:protein misato homolog 1-like n=1 Tax=Halichondria panicea TaxID=6063 RepID=UPI00312B7D53
MSEVITIQCGHYSNFIGTHLWNLQESSFEYDLASQEPREIITDVTFREGRTLRGEHTYTPRLIALDLPGSLSTLREEGMLYQPAAGSQGNSQWSGGVVKEVREGAVKNEFLSHLEEVEAGQRAIKEVDDGQYDLSSNVEVWSDFLRLHLHPNSLLMVPGHSHPESEGGFDTYPAGLNVWEDKTFRDSFEDKLHFFSEECDHLQGFQLLVDWDGGFGGVASGIAMEIADEYSSKGLFTLLASPLTQPLDKLPKFRPLLLNHCLSLSALCEHSSLVCPLSQLENSLRTPQSSGTLCRRMPQLRYEPSLAYHSSCLFGTGLDTLSLLYRTEQSPTSLSSLSAALAQRGRKVCSMSLSLPLSLPSGTAVLTELDHTPLHARLHPLTPFCNQVDNRVWSQAIALRGIPSNYQLCPKEDPRYLDTHRHASHTLAHHLSQYLPSDVSTQLCIVGRPLLIKPPYPRILSEEYHKNQQAPVCASLQSDPNLHQLLSTLTSELCSTNVTRYSAYSTTCLDEDSRLELTSDLSTLTDCYRTRMNPDSGSTDSD